MAAVAKAAADILRLLFCFRGLRTEQCMQKILQRYWLLCDCSNSPSPIAHRRVLPRHLGRQNLLNQE